MIITDPYIVGPWVCEKAGGSWVPGRGAAIGRTDASGALVAGVLYEDWNGANVLCHIRGEAGWANRRFLWMIHDYPFNQLGVKRITAPVASTNADCIGLVGHLGFELEACLKDAHPDGDILIYKLTPDKARWLHLKG